MILAILFIAGSLIGLAIGMAVIVILGRAFVRAILKRGD